MSKGEKMVLTKIMESARTKLLIAAIIIAVIVVMSACGSTGNGTGNMGSDGQKTKIQVFKSQSCGCCAIYASYAQKEKWMDVEVSQVADVSPIKEKYGVPSSLQSCHTSVVDGYFVEGHVPAEAISKLVAEKPAIKGIALPGMPSGSPGMPGGKTGDFVVYAVGNDGNVEEFMRI